ncbi:hypothetical protein BBFL7_00612 [Flavobacteria bacterium BBFL7]|nr:hypothetical protein BBFL7_00612 [Flavobacteria bacterium BBFL7]
MMKNIFYLLIILFSINSISSCKTVEIKQFERERAAIIHEVLSFYIKENPEFMEIQKANNIPSIYLSKTFRLNSSMFDIGMPMATIPSKFKKSNIPNDIHGERIVLFTDQKINKLEKKGDDFQYLFISELFYNENRIEFELKRYVFSNKKIEYITREIRITRSSISRN